MFWSLVGIALVILSLFFPWVAVILVALIAIYNGYQAITKWRGGLIAPVNTIVAALALVALVWAFTS